MNYLQKKAMLTKLAKIHLATNYVYRTKYIQKYAMTDEERQAALQNINVSSNARAEVLRRAAAGDSTLLNNANAAAEARRQAQGTPQDKLYRSMYKADPKTYNRAVREMLTRKTWHPLRVPGAEFLDYNPYTGKPLPYNELYPPAHTRLSGVPEEGQPQPRLPFGYKPIDSYSPPGHKWDDYKGVY